MLLGFLYGLRARGLAVGTQEWLTLMQALAQGLHQSQLTGFYQLARAILVHHERDLDAFDQAFAERFSGLTQEQTIRLTDELEQWLKNAQAQRQLSDEERAMLQALDLARLREQLAERLRTQRERHDGGNRWIGTGGTSPFGHGGTHPSGIRIGGESRGGTAAQVAQQRRFRDYRDDHVLDVRQIKVALRKLRRLGREGEASELDIDESIDQTCRNAGDLKLAWRAPRRNRVRVILMMDVGGSMTPHTRVVEQLFSAARQSHHFRELKVFYFHNCVYDTVYRDASFTDPVSLAHLIANNGAHHKLIMVGDALMHPWELLQPGGEIWFFGQNTRAGSEWLGDLSRHFQRRVWLNPEPISAWQHVTVQTIEQLFPMFPMTLHGLEQAIDRLIRG